MPLHEECGVFGIYAPGAEIASLSVSALYALQHRGQESCGVAISEQGQIRCTKAAGLVSDVFSQDSLPILGSGECAIAHARYGTTGNDPARNAQPMFIHRLHHQLALCHNGNLTNAGALREKLERAGSIFASTSDTEVIAYAVSHAWQKHGNIADAVAEVMTELEGAYSLAILADNTLIAARDPMGFRPLCIGKRSDGFVVASESCALDATGAEFLRDVRPGEILAFDRSGMRVLKRETARIPKSLCVFEYIYFARPDSVIDSRSVHFARKEAGRCLAERYPAPDADVVVGVPDSGLDAAIGFSEASGIPYTLGFTKNAYIGRTFIQPGQGSREGSVRIKLNPIAASVRGKSVVLVDDSIVRGTTSARIVRLLREAGARKIHMRISAPPFRFPCYFGTDIDSQENLIACHMTIPQIAKAIGADTLGYLDIADLPRLGPGCGLCSGCFSGEYPIPITDVMDKAKFE